MTAGTKQPAPRRWTLRILFGVAALLVLTWAAPIIAAFTPLPAWFCAKAFRNLNGSTHVGGASLGWFSPVTLFGVEFRDPNGRTVLSIPKVETERILLHLLFDSEDLGTIYVSKPVVEFTCERNESNFELVLEKLLTRNSTGQIQYAPDAGGMPKVHVKVVDGTLKLDDSVRGQVWQLRSLTVAIRIGHDAGGASISVRGITHDGNEPGTLDADIRLNSLGEANPKATIKGRFTSIPLAPMVVALRRYFPDVVLAGSLQGNGEIVAELRNGKPYAELSGVWIINYFILGAEGTPDRLYFERARIPCSVRIDDRKVIVEQADLDWDHGKGHLHGAIDFAAPWRDFFAQPDFDLTLDVNLGLICQNIADFYTNHGCFFLTGDTRTQIQSKLQDGAVIWQGKTRLVDVTGLIGKRFVNWAEPVVVDFKARDLHTDTPSVDRLHCSASFLRLESARTSDGFAVKAEADLQKLVEPLGHLVDPEYVQIAGKANATLNVCRTESNKFTVSGKAEAKQFALKYLAQQPLQEETVAVKFDAVCNTHGVDSARVDVTLGQDRLTVKLAEPTASFARAYSPFHLQVDGDLGRWQKRARSFTNALDDWQLAGQAGLQVCVRSTPSGIAWTAGNLVAINLRATGPSLWIREPALNAQGSGRWDAHTGQLDLTQTKIACPTVQLDADKLTFEPASTSPRGSLRFAADLTRLRQWTHDPDASPGTPIAGSVVGKIDLQPRTGHVDTDFDFAVKSLCYGSTKDRAEYEGAFQCAGRGSYQLGRDAFAIEKINADGAGFHADGAGTIANLSGTRDLELRGKLTYDLELLGRCLRPLLGSDLAVAGRDTRAFRLAGPLYPRAVALKGRSAFQFRLTELQGESSIAWQSLRANGCDVGPGDVKVVLREGWLQLHPIETTLNGGKLRLQPNLRFEPAPTELVLLPGLMIEKAKLTPALCGAALGRALPMLANGSEANGTISLEVGSGRLPTSGVADGDFKGTLIVHDARIGVTPLIRELSALLKVPPAPGIIKDCKVPIHVVNGRVHHSNLELAFSDFTVRSSGSVGTDGSLALVVEMPIPARLAAAANLTPAQARQTLRIPVGGTVDHPRPDPQAIEALTLGR